MLEKVKILLGISSTDMGQDELLEVLIEMAQQEAVEYCHLKEYNEKLNPAVINMVIERYNRMGSEGLASGSCSGISEAYIDGYSKNVYSLLNKCRKVRFLW